MLPVKTNGNRASKHVKRVVNAGIVMAAGTAYTALGGGGVTCNPTNQGYANGWCDLNGGGGPATMCTYAEQNDSISFFCKDGALHVVSHPS